MAPTGTADGPFWKSAPVCSPPSSRKAILPLVLFLVAIALATPVGAVGVNAANGEEKEVQVTGNTYGGRRVFDNAPVCADDCVADLQSLFDVRLGISEAKRTQSDTIDSISHVRVAGRVVRTYRFRQSGRITRQKLPFRITLVQSLPRDHRLVEAPSYEIASDSWFPGYYWSVVIVCHCATRTYQQVGWKFTSLDMGNDDSFYALIVTVSQSSERATAYRVHGTVAQKWMLADLDLHTGNTTRVRNAAVRR